MVVARTGVPCLWLERLSWGPYLMANHTHQQAKGENAMFRYKRLIGDRLRAKKPAAQSREARIAVSVLNRMVEFGMPMSEAVVAA